MRAWHVVAALVLPFTLHALATAPFPQNPDPNLTPGSLCTHPTEYRYPEHIPYCNRDVDKDEKAKIIRIYDAQLGYQIESMDRQDFKIDHYIPLCAGGSNDATNLWPQHKSVYEITDPLEPAICDLMAQGKLKQKDAIEFIHEGKNDLSKVPAILKTLENM